MSADGLLLPTSAIALNGFVSHDLRRRYRPTVVLALYDSTGLFFGQSAKDHSGNSWGMVQGGIKQESPNQAFLREGRQELGRPGGAFGPRTVLGGDINRLPPERRQQDKYLVFVAAYMSMKDPNRVVLDPKELSAWTIVRDPHQLWTLMAYSAEHRPDKFRLTCQAVNDLHRIGAIDWSCEEVMRQAGALERAA